MFYSDNPEMDFIRYDAHQAEELKKRPVCEHCGVAIIEDYYYEIFEEKVCSDCLKEYCDKNFKVSID